MKYRYSGNPKHQTEGLRDTTGATSMNNIRFHIGGSIKEGPGIVKADAHRHFAPQTKGMHTNLSLTPTQAPDDKTPTDFKRSDFLLFSIAELPIEWHNLLTIQSGKL